jgi:hypothetical protein
VLFKLLYLDQRRPDIMCDGEESDGKILLGVNDEIDTVMGG